jgi:hypothetical protein
MVSKTKIAIGGKNGHCSMIKVQFTRKDTTNINVYVPNRGFVYRKQKLTKLNKEMHTSTIFKDFITKK